MFDLGVPAPPEGWEPIPQEILAELGPVGGLPEGSEASGGLTGEALVDRAIGCGVSASCLGLLDAVAPESLTMAARTRALEQLTAIAAHVESVRLAFTAAIAGPAPTCEHDRLDDYAAHDVGAASRCSVYAAGAQVFLARELAGRLSATRQALAEGRISYLQARSLAETLAHLDDPVALDIEDRMLRFAHRQDLTLFKASLRRWLARLDPDWVAKAERDRREPVFRHDAGDDGIGEIHLRGPLDVTATIDTALTAYAAATKTSLGGTADARKLAALREWAEDYLAGPDLPARHGRTPTVNVIIDAPTLLGLAKRPAEIPGYGMVPASVALWALADGAPLRRLLIDEHDGRLLHYGHTTYTVPPTLAEHLIAVYQTSAAPHSGVPAAGCDLDHNTPYQTGGTTDPINVTPLDRRWHRAKTHAGWTYEKNPDQSITWTSPTGLTCHVDPHDYRLGP